MATQVTPPAVEPQQPEVDQATGKFVHTYQPRDKDGQFIGKPYRFLYTDHMDLIRQLEEAKENGDRYIHEVKSGKRQVNGEPARAIVEFKPAPEAVDEENKKRREDFRKTVKEEFGAEVEDVRTRVKRAGELDEYLAAQHWAMNKEAEGYYICLDNAKKIGAWLKEKNLANTPANYDLAFEELRDSLAKKPQETALPADSTQQPAPTRAAEARPQSTSIMPGQFQGTRQPNRTEREPLTRERFRQIDKMGRDEWKKLERNSPKEAAAFQAMKFGAQPQQ